MVEEPLKPTVGMRAIGILQLIAQVDAAWIGKFVFDLV
jgi:hypothetical protein